MAQLRTKPDTLIEDVVQYLTCPYGDDRLEWVDDHIIGNDTDRRDFERWVREDPENFRIIRRTTVVTEKILAPVT